MIKVMDIKDGVDPLEIQFLSPGVLTILDFYKAYCLKYQLSCAITAIIDAETPRKSDTHLTGRALDLRSNGWSEFHIRRFEKKCNEIFNRIGATRDNRSIACYWHDAGSGSHFHIQVNRTPDMSVLFGDF